MILRFGLDGAPERTLREVAKALGVSHERVRQIQVEFFNRVRDNLEPAYEEVA